jgi:hypothetical protein
MMAVSKMLAGRIGYFVELMCVEIVFLEFMDARIAVSAAAWAPANGRSV